MKILIVDDELLARERLKRLLDQCYEYDIIGEADSGRRCLEAVIATTPDIVLLDIRMPGMDGIETAKHLMRFENSPAIVFTTAYDEHAIEAFSVHAIGYLLKPIRLAELKVSLQQASRLRRGSLQSYEKQQGLIQARTHLCSHHSGHIVLIPIEKIEYCLADQKYTLIGVAGKEHLVEDTLRSLEEEFPDRFLRIHRNALISKAHFSELKIDQDNQVYAVMMGAKRPLHVSRRQLKYLKAYIQSKSS